MKRYLAQMLGLLLALALVLALLGCSSTKVCRTLFPHACDPAAQPCEPVYVTDYEKPTKLPLPEQPPQTLPDAPADDWRALLEAMGTDTLQCYEWGHQLQHIIESYNATVDSMPDPE